MRKVLFAVCAIGIMTMAFSAASFASATAWTIIVTAGSGGSFTSPNDSNGKAFFGTDPVSTDGTGADGVLDRDSKDGSSWPPITGSPALAGFYRPGWDKGTDTNATYPWGFLRDYRAPQAPGEVKTWADFIVWAKPGYTGNSLNVYLSNPTSALAPDSIGGHPVAYKVQMTYAPASYAGPREWIVSNVASLPVVSGSRLLLQLTLPTDGAIIDNPISATGPLAAQQQGGYRFSFVTPEPGSMVVLASGLTGLLGLIRRRKA